MVLYVVVGVFFLGWAVNTRLQVPTQLLSRADQFVIHLALPAVIIAKMSQVEIAATSLIPVAAAWGSMALCAVVLVLVARRMNWPRQIIGALLLVGVLGNTSFLGIEAVRTLLGSHRVAAAITYDQLGTFLALSIYGSWIAGQYGSGVTDWKSGVRRLVRFTPFLALLASMLLRAVVIPAVVLDVLNGVGVLVAPVAMGTLGLRFTLRLSTESRRPTLVAVAVKMFLVPAVLWGIAVVAGDPQSVEWSTSILQSAAPPMVSAGVLAISAQMDEEVVVAVVGVGTLLSFISLPLLSLAL